MLFIKFSGGTIYLKNNASSQILKLEILLGDQFQIKVTENVELYSNPKICKILDYFFFFTKNEYSFLKADLELIVVVIKFHGFVDNRLLILLIYSLQTFGA